VPWEFLYHPEPWYNLPGIQVKYILDKITILMNSDQKAKDIDWSQFRPWNIDPKDLQAAWDR
jgi:hypothetical protein